MKQTAKTRKAFLFSLLFYGIATVLALIYMFPLYWMIVSSFKPMNEVFKIPFEWLPKTWTFKHYLAGWHFMGGISFSRVYLNTFFVTVMSVTGTVFTASLVAFGFARINFKGRNILFLILLATMMLPYQVTIVPNYLIFNALGLIDTLPALFIGSFLGGGAFYIFMIRQFFLGIPYELDEAARIDGASTFRIFSQIILPLAKPVLLTVTILSFSSAYNDFFSPLILINSLKNFTVPVAIHVFLDEAGAGNIGASIAMTTLSIVPLLILFFSVQKQFMQGVVSSGLKG